LQIKSRLYLSGKVCFFIVTLVEFFLKISFLHFFWVLFAQKLFLLEHNGYIYFMKKCYTLLLLTLFTIASIHASAGEGVGDGMVKVARFYPNPASAVINFEFKGTDKTYNIQVFNFLGKRMINQAVTANKLSFSLETFYRGLYVFQLRDQAGNIVESGKFQVVK